MACEVEHTDEFEAWWKTLTETEQEDVAAIVGVLEDRGVNLPFPYSSGIESSKHAHMRELRIQSGGHPIRVFYALDPRRTGILLIGGDKTGNDRWYEEFVPLADGIYDRHLREIERERKKDSS